MANGEATGRRDAGYPTSDRVHEIRLKLDVLIRSVISK